jgi:hypothetical protein
MEWYFNDYHHCNFMKPSYHNVPVRENTFRRLRAYKMGGATYDEVLNNLMDALPLERVTAATLREHKRRLRSGQWVDLKDVRKSLGDD